MENNTVVYRHIRKDTNEVFYVGIGNDKRPYNEKDRSKWWKRIVNKTDYRIDILFDDMTWEEAIDKEIELITLYGRRDLGKGTLVNMTDGGEGANGYKHTEEAKRKISEGCKGKTKVFTEEHKRNMRKPKSDEGRCNMRKAKTEETRRKISLRISKPILQLDLEGNIIREWASTMDAVREYGFNQGNISACCRGKLKTHKGYKWKFKNK